MLRPTRFDHPDRTVIHAAYLILAQLKQKRLVGYEDLRSLVLTQIKGGEPLFIPAFNFLFLLGLLEYRPKEDTFEYTGTN